MYFFKTISAFFTISLFFFCKGQVPNYSTNFLGQQNLLWEIRNDSTSHYDVNVLPVFGRDALKYKAASTLNVFRDHSRSHNYCKSFWKKGKPFFSVSNSENLIAFDPIFEFSDGVGRYFTNIRGARMYGQISKVLGFYSELQEIQMHLPDYVDSLSALQNGALPYLGRSRVFKGSGYDLSFSEAYFNFSIKNNIRVNFGKMKNFVGSGIRSLLLSDFANNYLNLKLHLNVWRFNLVSLFSEYQNYPQLIANGSNWIIKRKYGAHHYLSYKFGNRLTLGLFESVIFDRGNGLTNESFDLNYVNPFLFYRSAEYYIGSPDNALVGLNGNYKLSDNSILYGQLVLDEFNVDSLLKENEQWWGNKYGYQLGFKSNKFFIDKLSFTAEWNSVRPFTYSYRTRLLSYSHDSQPLGHLLGSNFRELLVDMNYNIKRWTFNWRSVWYKKGYDSGSVSMGGDILKSYNARNSNFGHFIGQGDSRQIFYTSFHLQHTFDRGIGLFGAFTLRHQASASLSSADLMWRTGLRWNLNHRFLDF